MITFSRSQTTTLILVTLLLLFFFGWRHYTLFRQPVESRLPFPMSLVVQVSGEVRAPGSYSFDPPVTVKQAVTRAGGLILLLEPEPGWTSLSVTNGRRLYILADANGVARVRLGWMSVPSLLVLGIPLDINQSSAAELALVPGISPRLAKRIVAKRDLLGGFALLADLRLVDGIGTVSLKRLQQYLTVGSKQ